ncbi:MAG: M20/M25/M40 family metallo-hydrolase [bacterium]
MSGKTKTLVGLAFLLAFGTILFDATGSAASTLWNDTTVIDRISHIGQHDSHAMEHLAVLCNEIGTRPAGSRAHHETAEWAYQLFQDIGLSNVHLEQCGDCPGYPDAEWTEGFLQKLVRTVTEGEAEQRVPLYNVVADIPGTEIPDEYVIIGAHYDCVPIGSGALDNGTGVAAALEAARILMESDAKPRRTIRFVLFAGEESGLLGSQGYVEAHPDLLPKISAMYNMDHGTNYISGISATAPLKHDLDTIFAPMKSLNPEMPFAVTEVDWLLQGDPNCCQAGQLTQLAGDGPMVVVQAYKQQPDGSLVRIEADPAELEKLAAEAAVKGVEPKVEEVVVSGGRAPGCGSTKANASQTTPQVVLSSGCAPGCGGNQSLTIADLKRMGLFSDEDITNLTSETDGEIQVKAVAMGSSDQSVFLTAGVPGFWWAQDGDAEVAYPAHTADDTFDKVIPEYLEHSATVIALGALGTANLSEKLSREKLTRPDSTEYAETAESGE